MIEISGVQHVLLDIEGTTCPINFVTDVLFPYAQQQIPAFLADHAEDQTVKELVRQVFAAWDLDTDDQAISLRKKHQDNNQETVITYLTWLIKKDRKLTPLKELQGLIWHQGYNNGQLKAPLYADVPEALRRWHQAGLGLSVYSSGSVNAQKLLYENSTYGDLSYFFSYWFDTNIGSKQTSQSYLKIIEILNNEPDQVLFISDRKSELRAATEAGLKVLFSERQDNPETDSEQFISVQNYEDLRFLQI